MGTPQSKADDQRKPTTDTTTNLPVAAQQKTERKPESPIPSEKRNSVIQTFHPIDPLQTVQAHHTLVQQFAEQQATPLFTNDVEVGAYVLDGIVGKGAKAIVYKGYKKNDKSRYFAIKKYQNVSAQELNAEASAHKLLNHKNIAQVVLRI